MSPNVTLVESEEEREARVQRELIRTEERKKKERIRKLASIEAKSLLDSVLTEVQRECFKKENWFLVIGKSGDIYRINRGFVGNVDLLDPTGKLLRSFCMHINTRFPMEDNLVAQKLHLETDDKHFVENANVFRKYKEDAKVIDITPYLRRAS